MNTTDTNTTDTPSDLKLGSWSELQKFALPLRLAVFVQEQGVPVALEQDEFDAHATHAVMIGPDGVTLATGRLVTKSAGVAKIGRLAVARPWRRRGFGKLVLQALIDHASQSGVRTIKLHAQLEAQSFYSLFGFVPEGEPFMEAGIEHVLMVRHLITAT